MSRVNGKSAHEWIEENHPQNGEWIVYYKKGTDEDVTLDPEESDGKRWHFKYKNGVKINYSYGWYRDGTLKQVKYWIDGKRHGPLVRYYQNGQINDEFHYKNDVKHGTQTSYNTYGFCERGSAEYKDGELIRYSIPSLHNENKKDHPQIKNAKVSYILVWSDTNTMNRNNSENYNVNVKVNIALLQHTHILINQILKQNPHEILVMDNEGNFPKHHDDRVRVIPSYQSVGYLDGERPAWLEQITIDDYINDTNQDTDFNAAKSTAMAYNHGIIEATGDYYVLQHNDTLYLNDFDIKDAIIELEKESYAYITIDKKPPKDTSPKGYDYFADCYWFLCRKDFYSSNDIWVDWNRGDNNHLATITCKDTHQRYLHLPGFFENHEHIRRDFNKLYGYTHKQGNVHTFNDKPFILHLKGGTGLYRILEEKR